MVLIVRMMDAVLRCRVRNTTQRGCGSARSRARFLCSVLVFIRKTMRCFRPLLAAAKEASSNSVAQHIPRQKQRLPIFGLSVHEQPLPTLVHTYKSTLALLEQMPPSAVYRQSVESITRDRMHKAESVGGHGSEDELLAVESSIGSGYIEEVLEQAKEELALAGKMLEWKA